MRLRWTPVLLTALASVCGQAAAGPEFSTTELQYKRGTLVAPAFAGGVSSETDVVTLQHASGWSFGDLFLFVDALNDAHRDRFNDGDLYGEAYLSLSLGKLTGSSFRAGPVKDVGVVAGINAGQDAKVRKWLPGVRLYWDVPGFAFLNTDFTAYLDDSVGVARGGAPRESDSYMVDMSWACPFRIGEQSFSLEGHVEYIGERHNEFGERVDAWLLAQPQLRYDLGQQLFGKADRLYVGAQWQYWRHKLGDGRTEENALQALVVGRW